MATIMSVRFFGYLQAPVGDYYHGRRCSKKDPMNEFCNLSRGRVLEL